MNGPSRFRYRRSLASRVILLTTFAVGLSVAIVALAAYLTVRHQLQSSMDASLHRRAYVAAQYDLSDYTVRDIPAFMLGATDTKVGYVTADGRIVTTKGPNQDTIQLGAPELAVARGTSDYSCRTISSQGTNYRVATIPTNTDGIALVVAQSLDANESTLDRLGAVMAIFGIAGVIAAALAGWGVARNGLRPVRRLTEAAEDIARTENLDPIEVEGNDEIARLARAFNAMLAALSASRDRQRQLVADAGHELRTPLTSLRTNLDLLTQADRQGGLPESARIELLDDVRFQIEELTTLIGDLTELAREEPAARALEEVDLAEITERAVQRVRRRASSLQFDLHADPWWVVGDSASLERAVTNLLDNAAKWSPPLGTVTVRLTEGTLLVSDQGHGIDDDDLPHVFDRFYRSTASRTMPGSGLGLAIVRQVAERHGGKVQVGRSTEGGAAFWFEVPGRVTAASQRSLSGT
ncbi:HAMP domain-containing histidine kinase [Nocardioides panacis]|uniref:histidine kinase n=1 Tax=Nocardioides panacis TaxID=2849501 RepID=A0A975XZW8_9ACTN|nr:HAMP domain-containing sensor histidine kinase [Nocardioides panacis]QWZ07867.1 HAMP domain-containing histidine kinase [Nocardioides panacis]